MHPYINNETALESEDTQAETGYGVFCSSGLRLWLSPETMGTVPDLWPR